VDVREDRLPPAGGGELRKFVDEHLCELLDLPAPHPVQIGGKGHVDRVPADHPGEMPLERGPEPDHMGQQDLRMPGGAGDRHGVGKPESESFQVFQGLQEL
jgi:hypothetical protein